MTLLVQTIFKMQKLTDCAQRPQHSSTENEKRGGSSTHPTRL